MSFFHFLAGANALSSFRQQRLLASLADQGIQLDSIESQYLHFIWSTEALSAQDQKILASLLTYGQPFTGAASGKSAVVIPRLGTVSPWASKATDIARQCGLNVLRIERGAQFSWKAKKPLSAAQEQMVLAAVHDRMTAIEAERVFQLIEPLAGHFVTAVGKPAIGLQ